MYRTLKLGNANKLLVKRNIQATYRTRDFVCFRTHRFQPRQIPIFCGFNDSKSWVGGAESEKAPLLDILLPLAKTSQEQAKRSPKQVLFCLGSFCKFSYMTAFDNDVIQWFLQEKSCFFLSYDLLMKVIRAVYFDFKTLDIFRGI